MDLLFWGLTLGVIGKLILGFAVLRVHARILHEHKIDADVLRTLKKEQIVTLVGLALILIGYVLEMIFFSAIPPLLDGLF